jgi:hypothetical protein
VTIGTAMHVGVLLWTIGYLNLNWFWMIWNGFMESKGFSLGGFLIKLL